MAMIAGDHTIVPGTLARAIYDELDLEFGAAESDSLETDRRRSCSAMAKAIVGYLAASADVRITASDGGLQQVGGVDTDAPSSDVVLVGALE